MLKVGIIYGGYSPEYEFSLQSAETLIQHIDTTQFDIVPIHIDPKGFWILYDTAPLSIPYKPLHINRALWYRPDLLSRLPCDVIFPVLHGNQGEDGVMQGLFDLWRIPYVGSDVLGSAIGMNKIIAKQLVAYHDLAHIAPYVYFNQKEWIKDPQRYIEQAKALEYPVFIKPASSGSSVGIHRIEQEADLSNAIQDAFNYGNEIIIEQALNSIQEIEIALLENKEDYEHPLISAIGEVTPHDSFYSYTSKSSGLKGATTHIPAHLSPTQQANIESAAIGIFKALKLRDTARIDFFLDSAHDKIYFNEVNTLPGLTSMSMYPKLWEASGKSFTHIISHLIELALTRYRHP